MASDHIRPPKHNRNVSRRRFIANLCGKWVRVSCDTTSRHPIAMLGRWQLQTRMTSASAWGRGFAIFGRHGIGHSNCWPTTPKSSGRTSRVWKTAGAKQGCGCWRGSPTPWGWTWWSCLGVSGVTPHHLWGHSQVQERKPDRKPLSVRSSTESVLRDPAALVVDLKGSLRESILIRFQDSDKATSIEGFIFSL